MSPCCCSNRPPCNPPEKDPSEGTVRLNCQFPDKDPLLFAGLEEEPPPQAESPVKPTSTTSKSAHAAADPKTFTGNGSHLQVGARSFRLLIVLQVPRSSI